jgi:hypothetical protein
MSETGMLVLAGVGLAGFYLYNKKSTTVVSAPPGYAPNQYPPVQQYPATMGQPTPYNPGQWGGPVVTPNNPSQAMEAASIIGAIGGLAQGIGSVVRGIGSMGDSGGNSGYSDVLNWP